MNWSLKLFAKIGFLVIGSLFLTMQVFVSYEKDFLCITKNTTENPKEKISLHVFHNNGTMVAPIGNEANFLPSLERKKEIYLAKSQPGFASKLMKSLQGTMFTQSSMYNTEDKPDITVKTTEKKPKMCLIKNNNSFWAGIFISAFLGFMGGIICIILINKKKED